MHITLETDYAIRIVDFMAKNDGRFDAKAISEKTYVPQTFAMKILRKLGNAGIVNSYKGTKGGYELGRSPSELSLQSCRKRSSLQLSHSVCQNFRYSM